MVSMLDECLWFARHLRPQTRLLIAGGPLPTCDPEPFLDDFDVVVGEGEQTILRVARFRNGSKDSEASQDSSIERLGQERQGRLASTPERRFATAWIGSVPNDLPLTRTTFAMPARSTFPSPLS
jgi:radical SAM superfamily enzyme YgiQ (UPF0313 family)